LAARFEATSHDPTDLEADVRAQRSRPNFQAIARLAELGDFTTAFALRATCKLRLADYLAEGPRSADELAEATGTHAPSLLRALRALVAKDILAEPSPGRFELTDMGDLLRSDHPLSMRQAFRLYPDVQALSELGYTVRTGEAAFAHLFGEDYFTYLAARPELLDDFRGSQAALTRLELLLISRVYNWSKVGTLVDLGGNDGALMAALASRHPGMRGVLVDLPEAVAEAPKVFAEAGVANRCEIVSGSFFEVPIPTGADVYVIKRVLVGFGDTEAEKLLATVRAAMGPDSRLLVMEPMVTGDDFGTGTGLDVLMLVLNEGRVRTAEEFSRLLEVAGFTTSSVLEAGLLRIVEAQRG
jgi:O-methyltransferase domain